MENSFENMEIVAEATVRTDAFQKNSFFTNFPKDGQAKLLLWANFVDGVLKEIPDEVPAFKGKLLKIQLHKEMDNYDLVNKLPDFRPFEESEFAAIAKHLLRKRWKKDPMNLAQDGSNIFFVKRKAKLFVVAVYLNPDKTKWNLVLRAAVNHKSNEQSTYLKDRVFMLR